MKASFFMRNPGLEITSFMHQVFLAANENTRLRPLYCSPRPIKDNLAILQLIPFVMTTPIYFISEEVSIPFLLPPSTSIMHGRASNSFI